MSLTNPTSRTIILERSGRQRVLSESDDLAGMITVTGDTISASYALALDAPVLTLVRAPAGSTAVVIGTSFTTDVIGYYKFTLSNGSSIIRAFGIANFPPSVLTDARVQNPFGNGVLRSESRIRTLLDNWRVEKMRIGGRDALTAIVDALTSNAPLPAAFNSWDYAGGVRHPSTQPNGFGNEPELL